VAAFTPAPDPAPGALARAHAANDFLRYWFVEAGPAAWFRGGPRFDADLSARYGDLHQRAARSDLMAWGDDAGGALALVILLDQITRNLNRQSAAAFTNDPAARALVRRAIARSLDLGAPEAWRGFFYMPFMHSEALHDHDFGLACWRERLPKDRFNSFAVHHRDIVARFGRFPHRNRLLGRASTPAERDWLARGGFDPA